MTDHGTHSEDMTEAICHRLFFRDFVVRNHEFQKESGQTKEAADILVPFQDTLLAFQVRSKKETKPATEKTETDFARIGNRIDNAIGQLKTIKRALENNRITEVSNARGITVPFDCRRFSKVVGIVVLDLIGEEEFAPEERTDILQGFQVEHGMPIHIFMRWDLEELTKEIDTLPDFLEYLNARERLLPAGKVPLARELDFLAFYKTQYGKVQEAVAGQLDKIVIAEGLWEEHQKVNAELLARRDELNEPSYVVDAAIEWFHQAVGYHVKEDDPTWRADDPAAKMMSDRGEAGTPGDYVVIAAELASLPRLVRRSLGCLMLEKMEGADSQPFRYGFMMLAGESAGILFLASSESRSQRRARLYKLASLIFVHQQLSKVVGLTTEPLSADRRSYDSLVRENARFENEDELREQAMKFFKPPRHAREEEWG